MPGGRYDYLLARITNANFAFRICLARREHGLGTVDILHIYVVRLPPVSDAVSAGKTSETALVVIDRFASTHHRLMCVWK